MAHIQEQEIIILSSGSDDDDDDDNVVLLVDNPEASRSVLPSSGTWPRKRPISEADLISSDDDSDIVVDPPSTSSLPLDVVMVLSKAEADRRSQEIEALREEFGTDDSGWGAKVMLTKVVDRDIVSGISLSVMPLLNKQPDPTDSFSVVLISGAEPNVRHENHAGYRHFPPIRVQVELSTASNTAKFHVSCSWLVKDHIKRVSSEMGRRFYKHGGRLAPPFNWLARKCVKFLGLLRHRRIFYVTPDVIPKKMHHITFHDLDAVHKLYQELQAKLLSYEGTVLAHAKTFDCAICYDHKPVMAAWIFPGCKHFSCRACVAQDFSIKVREGQLKDLTCLENGCKVQADMQMVKQLVDNGVFQRYCDLTTDEFVDGSKMIIRCPKKECNAPMELIPNAQRELSCLTCGHKFCCTCRAAPHPNVPCLTDNQKKEIREEWKAADENGRKELEKRVGPDNVKFALEDAESEEWISKNAKPCPKCATPIQKIDGCNKMVCTSKGCRTYFCWLCGRALPQIDPYKHFSEPNGSCTGLLHQAVNGPGDGAGPLFPLNLAAPLPPWFANPRRYAAAFMLPQRVAPIPRPRAPRRPPVAAAQERVRHLRVQIELQQNARGRTAARRAAQEEQRLARAEARLLVAQAREAQRAVDFPPRRRHPVEFHDAARLQDEQLVRIVTPPPPPLVAAQPILLQAPVYNPPAPVNMIPGTFDQFAGGLQVVDRHFQRVGNMFDGLNQHGNYAGPPPAHVGPYANYNFQFGHLPYNQPGNAPGIFMFPQVVPAAQNMPLAYQAHHWDATQTMEAQEFPQLPLEDFNFLENV